MAEGSDDSEKTEDPTQKRLRESAEKGDVPKSQEVSTWFTLAGSAFMLAVFAPPMVRNVDVQLRWFLEHSYDLPVDGYALKDLVQHAGAAIAVVVGLPLVAVVLMAVAGNMVQHQLVLSAEPLKPKFSKISPISGFKRLFSSESLVNFAKGLLKMVIVAAIMGAVLWPRRDEADMVLFLDPIGILDEVKALAIYLLGAILAVMTVVAAADYLYQRHKWFEKQKMSQQEVKEEYKQTEGDPHIKGKIRQLRMERARRRMMAAVPKATVVIANPTHFAVALKYEDGMPAPICVAKGADTVAFKIRSIAEENDVPVIENPPLARALYAAIDLDEMIPEEHFKAVAEIIGFIFRMKKRSSWRAN